MSDALRIEILRQSGANDPTFSPLVYVPVIGIYFQGKALQVLDRKIKELIEEETRSVHLNCVPQMQHLLELHCEIYKCGKVRELVSIALVVVAFVMGYFPLILTLILSAFFGFIAIGATGLIEEGFNKKSELEGRNKIPEFYHKIFK